VRGATVKGEGGVRGASLGGSHAVTWRSFAVTGHCRTPPHPRQSAPWSPPGAFVMRGINETPIGLMQRLLHFVKLRTPHDFEHVDHTFSTRSGEVVISTPSARTCRPPTRPVESDDECS